MAALKRTLIGLCVIAAGVAGAVPFQRSVPSSRHSRNTGNVSPNMLWRRPDLVLEIPASHGPAADAPTVDRGSGPTADVVRMPEIRESKLSEHAPRAPRLATDFESISQRPDSGERADPEPEFNSGDERFPASSTSVPTAAAPRHPTSSHPAAERRHRIVEGDSLPALAARYLGSRQRWPEIFAANRDRLQHPELLPLGRELRIPLRSADAEHPAPPRATLQWHP